MRPIVRSIALLSAVALSTTALAVDDTVSRERHMVVLRAGTSPTEGEAVRERLVRSYGLKAPGTFSRGVLVGILVTGDPDSIARLKDEAKRSAVLEVANALLAAHGGRLLSTFAPSSAGFTAAMTEPQARALARDPRVRSVAEATFTLLD